jgi:hypothetical protein
MSLPPSERFHTFQDFIPKDDEQKLSNYYGTPFRGWLIGLSLIKKAVLVLRQPGLQLLP